MIARIQFGRLALAALAVALAADAAAQAGGPPASIKDNVGFDQKLNSQVPLDLPFRDENGRDVKLGDYFSGDKPVILSLVYYECPMMCTQVLNGLVDSLRDVSFEPGRDFEIVTVSFDPSETPELASSKKKTYLEKYDRPGADQGWHFLTGRLEPIRRLTHSVGFRYAFDERSDQFVHASGIVVLTPEGKASRYFYDVVYPPQDLRLGLVEASQHKIGNAVDYVLLLCFHYDPLTGKYTPAIMGILRLAGVATILAIAAFVGGMIWRERRKRPSDPASPTIEVSQ